MGKKLIDWIKRNREISMILLLGIILRLIFITRESFWYDEALTALSLKLPMLEMVRDRLAAGHSPFYFIVIYPFAKLFGTGEFAIRLPSAIASVISIYVFFLISRELFSSRMICAISTLFFTLSALNIYFAQEARMYAMCVLFVTLSFYYLLRALKENDRTLWLYYAASIAGSVYLSAIAVPVVFAQAAYVMAKKKKSLEFFLSVSFAGLLYSPLFSFYSKMKKLGFIEWLPPITLATFLEIFYGFGFKPVPVYGAQGMYLAYVRLMEFCSIYLVLALIFYGIASSLIEAFKEKVGSKDSDAALLLISWLAIPIILELLYSVLKQPMLGPKRYIIILSPAYYLLIGLGISRVNIEWLKKALTVCLIALFSASLATFYLSPTKEDWRGAVAYIDKSSKPGQVLFGDFSTHTMYKYYGKNNGMILVDVKYFYNPMFGERWLLLRERDFRNIFKREDAINGISQTKEIKGYGGLKLYQVKGKAGKQ